MKKICVFIGGRANYSSIRSAMMAIQAHPDLELQVVLGNSAILEKYGQVEKLIEKDGFTVSARCYMSIEGETPETMAKSTGLGLMDLSGIFASLKPDCVIVIGDRYEIMAAAIAAAYMNIPLAHTMGGEVTGTIDESIRHAVTKLAHIHFPANKESAERIIKLGEREDMVFTVGCPRIDMVSRIAANQKDLTKFVEDCGGVGAELDMTKPFLLVSQHPVTTEVGDVRRQIRETLMAVEDLDEQAVVLWPNSDAGSDDISKEIRTHREEFPNSKMRFFKNLPMEYYITLMLNTDCLIGNSSSGIREGEYLGCPCVNIGTRQAGRERGKNVIDVANDREAIKEAVRKHQAHGRYESEHIYGDGKAGERIADILAKLENVEVQKRITY